MGLKGSRAACSAEGCPAVECRRVMVPETRTTDSLRSSRSPRARRTWSIVRAGVPIVLGTIVLGACNTINVDPERATRRYPFDLKQESCVQIQVIPASTSVDVVNATARSYRDFDLWLNQRYMVHVDALEAGQTRTIALDDFWDWRGEGPFEGGIFRYYAPTPIALMQAQLTPTSPLIGFICVLPEGSRDFYENPSPTPQPPGKR